MILSQYDNNGFDRGRPVFVEILWLFIQAIFISSFLPGSLHRRVLLRWFGAAIGEGVVIKSGVRIKFPWRLTVGDYSWIGEGVWIDNLDDVIIGANCCLSQGAYLCTGSHDWSSERFELMYKPIIIQDHAWMCAHSKISQGVVMGEGAILTLGSIGTENLESWSVYSGHPARLVKARTMENGAHEAEVLTKVIQLT